MASVILWLTVRLSIKKESSALYSPNEPKTQVSIRLEGLGFGRRFRVSDKGARNPTLSIDAPKLQELRLLMKVLLTSRRPLAPSTMSSSHKSVSMSYVIQVVVTVSGSGTIDYSGSGMSVRLGV